MNLKNFHLWVFRLGRFEKDLAHQTLPQNKSFMRLYIPQKVLAYLLLEVVTLFLNCTLCTVNLRKPLCNWQVVRNGVVSILKQFVQQVKHHDPMSTSSNCSEPRSSQNLNSPQNTQVYCILDMSQQPCQDLPSSSQEPCTSC